MRAVVVYESMFGNTHAIAEAIGEGLGVGTSVIMAGVSVADTQLCQSADLVVVGSPTHVRGMPRPSTRKEALGNASKPDSDLVMEAEVDVKTGVREWLESAGEIDACAAAFDTRLKAASALTGRASKGIDHQLERHGLTMLSTPESFLVDKRNHLLPGETDRARSWGAKLAASLQRQSATSP
jgi:hypothetical protein